MTDEEFEHIMDSIIEMFHLLEDLKSQVDWLKMETNRIGEAVDLIVAENC